MTPPARSFGLGRWAKGVLSGRAGAVRIHSGPGNAARHVARQLWRTAGGAAFFAEGSRA